MEISYSIRQMVEDHYMYNFNFDYDHLLREKIVFQLSHHLEINEKNEEIIVYVSVKYSSNDETLAEQGVRSVFFVSPLHDLVTKVSDGGIEVCDSCLVETFVNVCIGALRGMLVKNLKGSRLDGVILPLIPMDVIRKNIASKK